MTTTDHNEARTARMMARIEELTDAWVVLQEYVDQLLAMRDHSLVASLTEALAVTSLAQPPSSAAVSGVEVVLEWDGLEERTLSVQDGTYRFDDFAAHTHKSTSDPAEARAWLAAALEAT